MARILSYVWYSTEQNNLTAHRAVPAAADALALVLLCIQRGSPEQAIAVLDSLSPASLANILSDNPSLLLEEQYSSVAHTSPSSYVSQMSSAASTPCNTLLSNARQSIRSFSELSSVLMDSKPAVLADVLARLVTVSKFATLQEILQVIYSNFTVVVNNCCVGSLYIEISV